MYLSLVYLLTLTMFYSCLLTALCVCLMSECLPFLLYSILLDEEGHIKITGM